MSMRPLFGKIGVVVNQALTATTASAQTAPIHAIGFILSADSTNTNPIRWCAGSTASTAVGVVLTAGTNTGYIPMAANLSVCAAVSGTNAYSVQWVLSKPQLP